MMMSGQAASLAPRINRNTPKRHPSPQGRSHSWAGAALSSADFRSGLCLSEYPWDMDLIGGQVFLFVLFTLLAVPCSMWDLIP